MGNEQGKKMDAKDINVLRKRNYLGDKMANKLKPVRCGCGGEPEICTKMQIGRNLPNIYILCGNCSIRTGEYYTEAEAITAWNKAMGEMEKCCNTCDSYEGHYCLLWSIFCPSDHYCKDWSWAETDEDEDEPAAQTRPL